VIAGVLAAGRIVASECDVELAISLPAEVTPSHEGYVNPADITVIVKNIGTRTVTLVRPGDGSTTNRRTPSVAWLVEGKVNCIAFSGCGNINALKPDEVFDLAPGATVALAEWIPPLCLNGPGTHQVQLTYRNDPTVEMKGIPLGEHDPGALERMRRSTPCDLKSNTALVTVRSSP